MKTPFTLQDIDQAHKGVTQKTVREYLKTVYDLGVISYTTYISDGHSDYFDIKGNKLSSQAVHDAYDVSDQANLDAARQALETHSSRQTDYFTFSRQLAAAGVCTWVMDPVKMTCTFHSKSGEPLLVNDV